MSPCINSHCTDHHSPRKEHGAVRRDVRVRQAWCDGVACHNKMSNPEVVAGADDTLSCPPQHRQHLAAAEGAAAQVLEHLQDLQQDPDAGALKQALASPAVADGTSITLQGLTRACQALHPVKLTWSLLAKSYQLVNRAYAQLPLTVCTWHADPNRSCSCVGMHSNSRSSEWQRSRFAVGADPKLHSSGGHHHGDDHDRVPGRPHGPQVGLRPHRLHHGGKETQPCGAASFASGLSCAASR